MLQQIEVKANEIYQSDFLKAANLNCSTKGARLASFVKYAVYSPLSVKDKPK